MKVSVSLLVTLLLPFTASAQETVQAITGARVACVDGRAAGFPCGRVDLLSFLPIADIGGPTVTVDGRTQAVTLNDIWGWEDPMTGRVYALVGRSDGTAFVDVTEPIRPVFVGILPSHELLAGSDNQRAAGHAGKVLHDDSKGVSSWRDVKAYGDFALVVADASPDHGVQFFDLKRLRDVTDPPAVFTEDAHYGGIGSAHNVAVNEESGYAYAVGSSGGTGDDCGGGLHMIDVRDPREPTFAGCFADPATGRRGTGYTHDVQCVIYRGPDADYQGREICIGSNETAISIADVTDKSQPRRISVAWYEDVAYVHQGWLTEDQRYFLQDDELDEVGASDSGGEVRTRTMVWDLADLDVPVLATVYEGTTTSIDHNLYIVGNLAYQANYTSGLRVLDIRDLTSPREVAFFDTYPANDERGFQGAWSNYPFFDNGIVVISSIREGLFVVDPFGIGRDATPSDAAFHVGTPYPNPFVDEAMLELRLADAATVRIEVFDLLGRRVARLHDGVLSRGVHRFGFSGAGMPSGQYFIRVATPTASEVRSVTLVR